MGRMLSQAVLALLPEDAAEIVPGVGIVTGEDGGGLVVVHGLATFAWDAGDEAGRRLAAVQLVRLRAASQARVAAAFGVNPATVWHWSKALAEGGVGALIPDRPGPKRASKLTAGVIATIAWLDAQGQTLSQIAQAAGVSTFSVRNALGRVGGPGTPEPGAGTDAGGAGNPEPMLVPGEVLPVLPDPVARGSERAASRFGLLGEGAEPVFAAGPGIRWRDCCWPCRRWRPPGWSPPPGRFTAR